MAKRIIQPIFILFGKNGAKIKMYVQVKEVRMKEKWQNRRYKKFHKNEILCTFATKKRKSCSHNDEIKMLLIIYFYFGI